MIKALKTIQNSSLPLWFITLVLPRHSLGQNAPLSYIFSQRKIPSWPLVFN